MLDLIAFKRLLLPCKNETTNSDLQAFENVRLCYPCCIPKMTLILVPSDIPLLRGKIWYDKVTRFKVSLFFSPLNHWYRLFPRDLSHSPASTAHNPKRRFSVSNTPSFVLAISTLPLIPIHPLATGRGDYGEGGGMGVFLDVIWCGGKANYL